MAAWVLVLVCIGCLGFIFWPNHPRRPSGPSRSQSPGGSQGVVIIQSTTPQRPPAPQLAAPAPKVVSRISFPEPTAAMRRFVNNLVNLDPANGPLSPEQVAAWKTNLQLLIQQGPNAIPAIHEFLSKNTDFDFGYSGGKLTIGYATARAAMFDALAQIGGSMAVSALAEVLQGTADPREIGLLGQSLEKLEPGMHQAETLDAARQVLAMASQGNLPDRDVAPLFEAIRQYGGQGAVAELEANAKNWNYYAMISLAQLPDGVGVPSLIQLASSGADQGLQTAALQMLAQVGLQSEDARNALMDQIRQNKLSPYTWAALAPILGGDQVVFLNSAFANGMGDVNPSEMRKMHIAASNQNFITAPFGELSPDQIAQQLAWIEQLLGATSDPFALQALQQARERLSHRAPQVATTGGKNG